MRILRNKGEKIFCIGYNKTGTTSVESALKELGFKIGDQRKGELLLESYLERDWNKIIRFTRTAEAFQDAPFSFPYTWQALHQEYPDSKFILTVRASDEWYESLIKFHSNFFCNGQRVPEKKDLLKADYIYKGYAWKVHKEVYNVPDSDIYNKDLLVEGFHRHNESIIQYFQRRSKNLLVLDVSDPSSYFNMCKFLNRQPVENQFPHLNKS